jgi:hypothetical protein
MASREIVNAMFKQQALKQSKLTTGQNVVQVVYSNTMKENP